MSGVNQQLSAVSSSDLFTLHRNGLDFDATVALLARLLGSGSLHISPIFTDVDGSTVTFDLSAYDWHQVTIAGNRAFALANLTLYQQFTVRIIQGSGGSHTVSSWFSGYTIKWPGGSATTLATSAGAVDVVTFKSTGPTTLDAFPAGANLS